ncbi:hypothetical protein B1F79_04075 [Coxiella-like endosymbiont of Rhipicephalus sanguineus]|nr:hypothetical protein [Coxiella-like endosymbiont of Rhipicephalus sanguineus]
MEFIIQNEFHERPLLNLWRDYFSIVQKLWKLLAQWGTSSTLWLALLLPSFYTLTLSHMIELFLIIRP